MKPFPPHINRARIPSPNLYLASKVLILQSETRPRELVAIGVWAHALDEWGLREIHIDAGKIYWEMSEQKSELFC